MASSVVGFLRILLTADSAEFEAGLKRGQDAAKAWEKNLKSVGQQATAIGSALTKAITVPIVGMAGASVKAAIDFESSFAGIRKTVADATDALGNLTPVGATLAQGMRDLALTMPVNVNELNRIGEAAGQLGIKSGNIIGFTEVMAKLGVTTNLSSDQAATALARLANITGMPQTEFGKLGSTIVALGNNLATTEAEITEFGLRIAGAGEIAGLTEAEILAIGGAMSSVGVEAEAGGTAVQKVLLGMTQAAATGGDGLETFARVAGLSAREFAERWKSDAAAAFTLFVEGLGKSGTDAFGILEELGLQDQRLIRSFLSLAGAGDLLRDSIDIGTTAWRENTALTKEAEQRFGTTESQLQMLWATVRDVGIELGDALLPTIRQLVEDARPMIKSVSDAVKWFGDLPQPVRETALAIGMIGALAGPAIWGLGQMAISASAIVGAFKAGGILAAVPGLIRGIGAAAWAAAPQLGAFAVAAASVMAVGKAVREAHGLMTDKAEQARLALEQGKSHALALAAASQVAGRQITDLAEAHTILRNHAADLRAEQQRLAPAQADVTTAVAETTPAVTGLSAALREAEKDTKKSTTAQDGFAASIRTGIAVMVPYKAALEDQGEAIQNIARGLQADGDLRLGNAQATTEAREEAEAWAIANGAVLAPSIRDTSEAIREATTETSTFGETFRQSLSELPKIILGAFQGGGDVLKSIGSHIGGTLGTNIVEKFGASITGTLGKTLGGAINSIIPGVGALLGPLVSKIGGALKSLFGGVSEDVKQARSAVAQFEDSLIATLSASQRAEAGGQRWAQVLIAVRDAYLATGRSSDEAEAAVDRLWASSRSGPEAAAAAIAEVNAVLGEQAALNEELAEASYTWQDLQQQAEAYGVDLSALGPQFASAKLNEQFSEMLTFLGRVRDSGGDVGGALAGVSDEISEMVQQSRAAGVALPENLREYIAELARAGLLLDEQGNQITDISTLEFTEPLEVKVGSLVDAIRDLITEMARIPTRVETEIHRRYTSEGEPGGEGEPGFATGTINRLGKWFGNFPTTGFATSLHGTEAVVTPAQAPAFAMDVLAGMSQSVSTARTMPSFGGGGSDRPSSDLRDTLEAVRRELRMLSRLPQQISTGLRTAIATTS